MATATRLITDVSSKEISGLLQGDPIAGVSIPPDYPDAASYLTEVLFASAEEVRKQVGSQLAPILEEYSLPNELKSDGESLFALLRVATAAAYGETDAPKVKAFFKDVYLNPQCRGWPSTRADCHRQALFALTRHGEFVLRQRQFRAILTQDLSTDEYVAAAFGAVAVVDRRQALRVLPDVLVRMSRKQWPVNAVLHTTARLVSESSGDASEVEEKIRQLKGTGLGEDGASLFRNLVEKCQSKQASIGVMGTKSP